MEETGLKVRGRKVVALSNDIFTPTMHYVTLFVLCERETDEEPLVSNSTI